MGTNVANRERHRMLRQVERGTKRTCQNEECGARFYDLVRDPIACPICRTAFVVPPAPSNGQKAAWKTNRGASQYPIVQAAPFVAVEEVAAELDSDKPTEAEDAETVGAPEKPDLILDVDEDDGEEANVVKRPVAEDEKGERGTS